MADAVTHAVRSVSYLVTVHRSTLSGAPHVAVRHPADRRRASKAADAKAAADAEKNPPKQLDALHTEHGDTTIADTVVAKIAGIATREVPGRLRDGQRRPPRDQRPHQPGHRRRSANVTGGVSVEKGESQTAIDVSVVVEYGVSIVDVSEQIRENVIRAVEYGTGLEVVSVDVNVTDVHLPDEDDDTAVLEQQRRPALTQRRRCRRRPPPGRRAGPGVTRSDPARTPSTLCSLPGKARPCRVRPSPCSSG